jgi:hypothetical protein
MFQMTYLFRLHYGPEVDSASNRNEYQEPSLGLRGDRPKSKDDSITVAICEPIV